MLFRQKKYQLFFLSILLLAAFFVADIKEIWAAFDPAVTYSKTSNGQLSADEWNNLQNDFVHAWGNTTAVGGIGIGVAPQGTDFNGLVASSTIKTNTSFLGYLSAAHVTPGAFNSIAKTNGNFSFPVGLGIGTTPVNAGLHLSGSDTYSAMFRLVNSGASGGQYFMGVTNTDWIVGGNKLVFGVGTPTSTNVKMVMGANGNVGIGTTAPVEKLHVVGNNYTTGYQQTGGATYTGAGLWFGNNQSVGIYKSTNDIRFKSTSDLMTIAASGKVGIGTTAPAEKLHVVGNIDMTGTDRKIYMGGAGGTTFGLVYNQAYPNYGLFYYREGSPDFVTISPNGGGTTSPVAFFGGNGNVGIGTTTPNAKLSVSGGNIFINDAAITSATPNAAITKSYLDSSLSSTTASIVTQIATSSLWQGSLTGSVYNNNSGNVGIGTSTPTEKLEVVGNIRANGLVQSLQTGGSNYMFTMDATSSGGPRLQLGTLSSPASYFEIGAYAYINNFNSKDRDLKLYTNNGFLYLNATSGNVGIGTTAPGTKLQIYQPTRNTDGLIIHTAVTNSDSTQGYGALSFQEYPDKTGNYSQIRSWSNLHSRWGSQLSFHVTTGGSPALTEAMRINASGNIGINTATPGYKLDVVGDANFNGNQIHGVAIPTQGTDAVSINYLKSSVFLNAGNSFGSKAILGTNDNFALGLETNGAERMTILANGNVGIGTTNPLLPLQVNGRVAIGDSINTNRLNSLYGPRPINLIDTNASLRVWRFDSTTTNASQIELGIGVNDDFGNAANKVWMLGAWGGGQFTISDRTGGGNGVERLRINPSGNVGIGTTTPNYKLDVFGEANFNGNQVHGVSAPTQGTDAANKNYVDSSITPPATTTAGIQAGFWTTGAGGSIYNNNSSGKVGIGTTNPSLAKFQIEAGDDVVGQYINGGTTANIDLLKLRANAPTQRLILEGVGGTVKTFLEAGGSIGLFGTVTNHHFRIRTNYVDRMTFDTNGNVGIGTTTPNEQLEITKNFRLPTTSGTTPYGVIYKDGNRFIHDFSYGLNSGGITPTGFNTFIGIGAGNFTMGSTATASSQASYNTGIGYGALQANTTGSYNTANGFYSLYSNTTGYNNTANGFYSLRSNTTGSFNTANGMYSLSSNTTGSFNTANGYLSLSANTTGNANTANGVNSLPANTTGSYNTALGFNSGRYIANGTTGRSTGNNGLYLGYNSKASDDGTNNEIVIGANAVGNGSNTATYGNTSMLKHIFSNGNLGIGTTTPGYKLDIAYDGGGVNLAGNAIHNLGAPVTSTDAVNRYYVDSNFAPIAIVGSASLWATSSAGTYNVGLGNVGIGTTNPIMKLDVQDTSGPQLVVHGWNTVGANVYSGSIQIGHHSTVNSKIQYNGASGSMYIDNFFDNTESNIYFRNRVSGTPVYSMVIKGTGNVGIGTTTPETSLDVNGLIKMRSSNITTTSDVINKGYLDSALTALIASTTASTTASNYWSANGSNIYNKNTTGNVGIGTTTPAQSLNIVNGISEIRAGSGAGALTPTLSVINNNATGKAAGIFAGTNYAGFDFSTDNGGYFVIGGIAKSAFANNTVAVGDSPFLTIGNTGNVGIGTTSPTTGKLVVVGDIDLPLNNAWRYIKNTAANGGLRLGTGNSSGVYTDGIEISSSGGYVKLNHNTTVNGNLYATGNVGIGISSPAYKLDIAYNGSGVNFAGNQLHNLAIPTADTDAVSVNYLKSSAFLNGGNSFGSKAFLGTNDNYALGFEIYGTERMTILANGNVGIGTTNPNSKVDIMGTYTDVSLSPTSTAIANFRTPGHVQMSISAQLASPYTISLQGKHASASNSSYPIALNPLGGNVGIGTTSPATKLDVNGIVTATGFSGPLSGTINAVNVSKGVFGLGTGQGTYHFGGITASGDSHYQWEGSTFRNPGDWTPQVNIRQDNATTGINGFKPALSLYNENGDLNSTVGLDFVTRETTASGSSVALAGIMAIKESAGTYGAWTQGGLLFYTKNMGTKVDALRILNDGNVGIGTINPGAKLDVNSGIIRSYNNNTSWPSSGLGAEMYYSDSLGAIFQGYNRTGSAYLPVTLRGSYFSFSPLGAEKVRIDSFGNVGIGTTDPGAFKLKVAGNVAITGTLQTMTGADFAEEFAVSAPIEAGTVVVMGDLGYKSVKACAEKFDSTVVGVVSDNPSIIAGRVDSKYKAIVAMTGVVKVKASNINGSIKKGTMLTTANISGYAMKADNNHPGTIIGKALEDLSGQQGEIKVLINLQ